MSMLNTGGLEGGKKFYREVFGWNADSMGEMRYGSVVTSAAGPSSRCLGTWSV